MRVRAKQLGYYGLRRMRVGDTFVLRDPNHFSTRWMDKVDDSVASTPKGQKKKLRVPGQDQDVPLLDGDELDA